MLQTSLPDDLVSTISCKGERGLTGKVREKGTLLVNSGGGGASSDGGYGRKGPYRQSKGERVLTGKVWEKGTILVK